MNNVIIDIKGKQKYPGSKDWDVTEFSTEGELQNTENGYRITYDESNMIGAENVKSEIIIEDGTKAEISRTGKVSTRMTVEKGKRHSCFYSTPEGDFTIGIFGESVSTKFKELKGEVYLSYTIDVNSSLISENKMEIKIKELRQ
ncbi:MAG: DUF1934 domain-containing protein [Clostridia bacterium]|nr:DUF1934 domain-containing protein [Clostridia bacterium]